jgi:hypothetical protein
VTFEYGTTTSYGSVVIADQSPINGTADTAVSAVITGLSPGTTYFFRVVGTNSGGTTNGASATFTTPQVADIPGLGVAGAAILGGALAAAGAKRVRDARQASTTDDESDDPSTGSQDDDTSK